MSTWAVSLAIFLALAEAAPADARHWTSESGKSFDAEFVSADAQRVRVRFSNGTIKTIQLEKLSVADRQWVSQQQAAAVAKPGPATTATGKIVYLDRGSYWSLGTTDNPHFGFLSRELARQAFLLAAHEELGLSTRDAWLGDRLPTAGANEPWDVVASAGTPSLLEVTRGFAPATQSVWRRELTIAGQLFDYERWTTEMEQLARGPLVGVLEQAGLKRLPRAADPGAGAAIRAALGGLDEMNFITQFAAVRALDEQSARGPDETLRLAGLVRGYANLGVMSEYFWNPMHNVFKARALLYAQRLAVREKQSAWALAHRAYARAMVGLHAAALADFVAVESERDAGAGPAPADQQLPAWIDLLTAYCRFDNAGLKADKPERQTQLAALLRLLAAEQAGVGGLIPKVAMAEMANAPDCFRIRDGFLIHRYYNHPDSRQPQPPSGSALLGRNVYQRLSKLVGMPANVQIEARRSVADEPAHRQAVVEALLATDGPELEKPDATGTLNWALLGRMIREMSFYQAWRQARPDMDWGGGAGHLAPTFADHPGRVYLEVGQAQGPMDLEMLEWQEWPMIDSPEGNLWGAQGGDFMQIIRRRLGDVARDRNIQLASIATIWQLPFAQKLIQISPYHPAARTVLIEQAWDQVRGQTADWPETSATQPAVLLALGKRYLEASDLAAAERALKAAVAAEPSQANYKSLIQVYAKLHDSARWLAAMDELIAIPGIEDRGSLLAAVNDYLMAEGEWERAKHYADAALEAGGSIPTLSAAAWYEAQQDWEPAERAYRRASKADPGVALDWYFFCKRTGQGDAAAALLMGKNYLEEREQAKAMFVRRPDLFQQIPAGTFYLLSGEMEKARVCFDEEFTRSGDPFCGLHSALISDRLNDVDLRDSRLKAIPARLGDWNKLTPGRPRNEVMMLVGRFVIDLARGAKADFDLTEIDKQLAAATEIERVNCRYFLADYLARHGQPDKAVEYWQQCAAAMPMRGVNRTLACAELCDRAVLPKTYRAAILDRPQPKPAGEAKP